MATIVDLLRHGEPEGGQKYRGGLDDPLCPEGWRQMHAAVQGHPPWDLLVSSPLQRCAAFARSLSQQLNNTLLVDERLREMSFGQWEGQCRASLLATDRQRLTMFWRDPLHNPPPGGEHLVDFHRRVQQAWEELLDKNQDRSVLVVAHGGVIRVILCLVLHIPLQHLSRITVEYASLSRIKIDEVEGTPLPRLLFHTGGTPPFLGGKTE